MRTKLDIQTVFWVCDVGVECGAALSCAKESARAQDRRSQTLSPPSWGPQAAGLGPWSPVDSAASAAMAVGCVVAGIVPQIDPRIAAQIVAQIVQRVIQRWPKFAPVNYGQIISGNNSGINSGNNSGINSGNNSGNNSDINSGINSGSNSGK